VESYCSRWAPCLTGHSSITRSRSLGREAEGGFWCWSRSVYMCVSGVCEGAALLTGASAIRDGGRQPLPDLPVLQAKRPFFQVGSARVGPGPSRTLFNDRLPRWHHTFRTHHHQASQMMSSGRRCCDQAEAPIYIFCNAGPSQGSWRQAEYSYKCPTTSGRESSSGVAKGLRPRGKEAVGDWP